MSRPPDSEANPVLDDRVEERTRRLRTYARRLELLREVDHAILRAESPTDIATAALRGLHGFLPAIRSSVTMFCFDTNEAEILAMYRSGETELKPGMRIPMDHMPTPKPLYEGNPVFVDDLSVSADTVIQRRLHEEEGVRSYMCLPMRVDGELIGIMNVGASEPSAYGVHEQQMAQEVANPLAIAIRQARLTEQVRRHSDRLEQRVAERTEELESFTYSVSHDLRTPLRAIDGYARLLMERSSDQLDEEGERLLGVIYENTQKMGRLIDDLLSLSRLGRQELRRREIDMRGLVEEAMGEAVSDGEEERVTVQVSDLPSASADRAMLRRVWVNLLSNAIKFTRDTEAPRINVYAVAASDCAVPVEEEVAPGQVVYVIEDNGAGFDDRYIDKLFGVFQRLHDDTDFQGTGVGLAIVDRVIRRHGGCVWAESKAGEGATFYFTLGADGASV
ncbi:sensor histidine kinase [Longibacter salinarum]|nr:ATP-binding protein [Longibacter salinarum]